MRRLASTVWGAASQRLSAEPRRPATVWHLRQTTIVPASLDRTFAFFADAANLERLTPPWLNFTIETPAPLTMSAGALIDYRIRLYGVPIPWRTQIDIWEPGVRFVDRQIIGPYRWWFHEHSFEEVESGTRVIDHVEYLPRARWLSLLWVRRDLRRIFGYRQAALQRIFSTQLNGTARE
jgi:ligand-binding SRPBCC domain-containing protein